MPFRLSLANDHAYQPVTSTQPMLWYTESGYRPILLKQQPSLTTQIERLVSESEYLSRVELFWKSRCMRCGTRLTLLSSINTTAQSTNLTWFSRPRRGDWRLCNADLQWNSSARLICLHNRGRRPMDRARTRANNYGYSIDRQLARNWFRTTAYRLFLAIVLCLIVTL